MAQVKAKNKGRRWLIFLALPLCLAAVAYWKLEQMGDDAFLLAETGRSMSRALGDVATALKAMDAAKLSEMIDDGYANGEQGPWTERLESQEDGVRVYRLEMKSKKRYHKPEMVRDLTAFQASMDEISDVKFKLAGIENLHSKGAKIAHTTLWLLGRRGDQKLETKIKLSVHMIPSGDTWHITNTELKSGTLVLGSGAGFTNMTLESGLGSFLYKRNPDFETEQWNPKMLPIVRYSSAGVTTVDYDNDGFYDLFFPNGERAALYRNLGNGQFQDVTTLVGFPAALTGVNVALFADLDNDGDKDAIFGSFTRENLLFRNNGDGTFSDVSADANLGSGIVSTGAVADIDNDGDLDVYFGRYLDPRIDLPTTPFLTRNGNGNSLLRNDGNFHFTDITQQAGVAEGGLTLGTVFADYDRDGDQDLYVANDFGRNALFRNRGDGTFDDVAKETGTIDMGFGMSASFGDADDDGDLDIYVANVHSGQRWFGQAPTLKNYLITSMRMGTFFEDLPIYRQIFNILGAQWSAAGDHIIKGNSLMLNDGTGHFKDYSVAANANPHGWYWGSDFLDYDNDGRQDIYTTNGWISAENHDDFCLPFIMGAVVNIDDYKQGVMFQPQSRGGMSWNGYERNVLLRNQGHDANGLPQYVDVARATGADDILDARGLALLDYDNDGDLDLLVSHNPGDLYAEKGISPSLLRNDIGHKRNWLAISLEGKTINRDAIGAEVIIEFAGQKALRLVSGGSGYASQSSQRLYFGMGASTTVERLTVRWPGGKEEYFKDLQSCRLIHITEGEGLREQSLPGLNSGLAEHGAQPKASHL